MTYPIRIRPVNTLYRLLPATEIRFPPLFSAIRHDAALGKPHAYQTGRYPIQVKRRGCVETENQPFADTLGFSQGTLRVDHARANCENWMTLIGVIIFTAVIPLTRGDFSEIRGGWERTLGITLRKDWSCITEYSVCVITCFENSLLPKGCVVTCTTQAV